MNSTGATGAAAKAADLDLSHQKDLESRPTTEKLNRNLGQAGPSGASQSDDIVDFMRRVVPWPAPGEQGYINLHWLGQKLGMPGLPYTDVQAFIDRTRSEATHPRLMKDIYFCLSRQAEMKIGQDGKHWAVRRTRNATHVKAIWFDVDVKSDQPDKNYTSTAELLTASVKFCADAALPGPSAVVASGGGGLHIYWISDRALTVEEWRPYAEGLRALAIKHGFKCDAGVTTDVARVLRVPGTFNRKHGSSHPVVLKGLGRDYDFTKELAHILVTTTAGTTTLASFVPTNFNDGPCELLAGLPPEDFTGIYDDTPLDYTGVLTGCPHFRETFKTHGRDNGQGLWMLDVLASTFFDDGYRIAHTLSEGYKTYTRDETDAMWERKLRERKERGLGWPGCAAFEKEGCKHCATCKHFGNIKSPLNLTIPIASSPQANCNAAVQATAEKELVWNIADLKVSFSNIPHRQWLYGFDLVRGEITVLGSPGGIGKSSLAIGMAVSIATCNELLGEKVRGGNDLKVIIINAEDDGTEIKRRVWAFCLAHKVAEQSLSRLYVAGKDDAPVQRLSFLRTTDKNVSQLDESGFKLLEAALETLCPDVIVLDPLVAFCGGGNMNDNTVMSQVMRELKRLATKFNCAMLIVHHTRKGGDVGNAESISGAAAIVNLARRAIMPVPMAEKEATQFGILPSERFGYFKLIDAKSNLAPRSADSPWYLLNSIELPNPEPPLYPHGDSVQALVRINLSALLAAPATTDDQKIRNAILDLVERGKFIDGKSYPYSPSPGGAHNERALLDEAMATVSNATAPRQWRLEDLKAAVLNAIKKLKTEGFLVVKDMKELTPNPGRFRKVRGLSVERRPQVGSTNDTTKRSDDA